MGHFNSLLRKTHFICWHGLIKCTLLILIFMVVTALSLAQQGWYWQNPLPQGNNLYDVYFHDRTNGWALGADGTILYTNDQGYSWEEYKIESQSVLYGMFFTSVSNGWIVGQHGTILYWDGTTWEEQESNYDGLLYDVYFINSNTGWAVGQDETVLHTADGGLNWTRLTFTGTQHYFSVYFIDENEGYLCGAAGNNGVIKHTTNGGDTWSLEIIPANRMNSIWFGDDDNGWAVGDNGAVFHKSSSAGGWALQSSGTTNNLTSVDGINIHQVWICGEDGEIRHTNNGGDTWFSQNSSVDNDLRAVHYHDGEVGWAVGDEGVVTHSNNGGGTWNRLGEGPTGYLREISFNHPSFGLVVGDDGLIYYSIDDGETWNEDASGISSHLNAVDIAWHAISYDRATAVGDNGNILRVLWEPDMTDEPWVKMPYDYGDEFFAIDNYGFSGWAAGIFGTVIHTSNGGSVWERQHQDMGYHLYDIQFQPRNHVWAVGMGGNIIYSPDRGDTWEEQVSNTFTNLHSVSFADYRRGWAVGLNGTIIHTNDGGSTWEQQTSGTYEALFSVFFIDENNGWIAGDAGTILHTNDGGLTWGKQISGTNNTLFSVFFSDLATGWVCGEKGTILHTVDGGGATLFEVYERIDVNEEILDLLTTEDGLTVGSSTKVASTDKLVGVQLTLDDVGHTSVGDLTIMFSHAGVMDTVMYHSGEDGDNILNMTFSDALEMPADSAVAPFTGGFKPYKPLSAFNDLDPTGAWILRIRDDVSGNTGVLNAWSLKLFLEDESGTTTIKNIKNNRTAGLKCYPNPVRNTAIIKYYLSKAEDVELSVFDLSGRKIRILQSSRKPQGVNTYRLNTSSLASGIYFIQLKAGNINEVNRILVE